MKDQEFISGYNLRPDFYGVKKSKKMEKYEANMLKYARK